MENSNEGQIPDMINFDCPAIMQLWKHSGVPAGEDVVTQFLCKVVW